MHRCFHRDIQIANSYVSHVWICNGMCGVYAVQSSSSQSSGFDVLILLTWKFFFLILGSILLCNFGDVNVCYIGM